MCVDIQLFCVTSLCHEAGHGVNAWKYVLLCEKCISTFPMHFHIISSGVE